jgi:hypothetical protein
MRANLLTVLILGLSMLAVPTVYAAEPAEGEQQEIELREKIGRMMQEARELKEAGNEAQSRELMEQAGQLMREAKEAAQARAAEPREGGELQDRLEAMKGRIMALRREGRVEEAERLERETREFMQRAQWKERPAEQPTGDEAQRRMHHLRVAAENLRAAGLHEQAEQLMRQVERMMASPEVRRPDADREAPVRELAEAMRRLNQRVERLEQALKKLMDQQQ